jgi:hypothetical protein
MRYAEAPIRGFDPFNNTSPYLWYRIRLDPDCYIAGENCGEITHLNSCAFFQDPFSSGRTILKELAVLTYGDS